MYLIEEEDRFSSMESTRRALSSLLKEGKFFFKRPRPRGDASPLPKTRFLISFPLKRFRREREKKKKRSSSLAKAKASTLFPRTTHTPMSFYRFFTGFYSSLWRAGGKRNRDNEWWYFSSPNIETRLSLFLASLEKLKWERERDYITVTLISIVNTRTKLTLSLWKVWRMRKELDSRRREIDRVGNRWQYRLFPLPLSYNFKMPWKMKRDVRNVRISLDGVSLIIN